MYLEIATRLCAPKNPIVTNNKPCLGKHGEILSPVLGEGAPMFVLKAFVESEKE